MTGSGYKLTYLPLPQDDPIQRCPDITLAKKEMDWVPKVDLHTGLILTINYFKKL
jgi:UDP-glucuronate decarboxylase